MEAKRNFCLMAEKAVERGMDPDEAASLSIEAGMGIDTWLKGEARQAALNQREEARRTLVKAGGMPLDEALKVLGWSTSEGEREPFDKNEELQCRTIAMKELEYADEIAKLDPRMALQLWDQDPNDFKKRIIGFLEFQNPRLSEETKEKVGQELAAHISGLKGSQYLQQKGIMADLLDSIHNAVSEVTLKDYLRCACRGGEE